MKSPAQSSTLDHQPQFIAYDPPRDEKLDAIIKNPERFAKITRHDFKTFIHSLPHCYDAKTSFHRVAQDLIRRYYLRPYPGQKQDADIPRLNHGGLHVCSAVYVSELFPALLKKYFPDHYQQMIATLHGGSLPTEQDLLMIKYAILCHDIGNEAEMFDDAEAHARIYRKEMHDLGFSTEKIKIYALAIVNKDCDEDDKTFAEMMIHDADAWEMFRVLDHSSEFDIEELDIVKLFRKHLSGAVLEAAIDEVEAIANFYPKLVEFMNSNEIHKRCELADNCFLETGHCIQSFRIYNSLEHEYSLLDENMLNNLIPLLPGDYITDALQLYNPTNTQLTAAVLRRLMSDDKQTAAKHSDDVLALYQRDECLYVRTISGDMTNELNTVARNQLALEGSNITTSAALRDTFLTVREQGISDFKFRPMTMRKRNIVSETCKSALIHRERINPPGIILRANRTLSAFFYKQDAFSCDVVEAGNYDDPELEDQGSEQNLAQKMHACELSRCGLSWDNDDCYGLKRVPYPEVLASYAMHTIVGIIPGSYQDDVRDALYLRIHAKKVTGRAVPFYHFEEEKPVIVADDVVLQAALEAKDEDSPVIECKDMPVERLTAHSICYQKDEMKEYYHLCKQLDRLSITCSLGFPETDTPEKKQVTYFFKHDSAALTGRAYVHDRFPVICLNEKLYYDHEGLLLDIERRYQENRLQKVNDLLPRVARMLNLQEIIIIKNQRAQFILEIELRRVVSRTDKMNFIQSILGVMGYQRIHRWQVLEEKGPLTFSVRLYVPQAFDAMHSQLSRWLAQSLEFLQKNGFFAKVPLENHPPIVAKSKKRKRDDEEDDQLAVAVTTTAATATAATATATATNMTGPKKSKYL